jgi:cysteine desulfurase
MNTGMANASLPIYLDHNASTPILPEVLDAMLPYLRDRYGNPSSTHHYGRVTSQAIELARRQVAALIECEPGELYFTSGGTEANNLAIRGAAAARPDRRRIVTSVIEHPATLEPCTFLERNGYSVYQASVDEVGRVRPDDVTAALSTEVLLLTIMHANSETGTLQAIHELSGAAHKHGALIHSDAAQSVGKVPVSVRRDQVDLMSIAGHKLYAPKGIGALYVRAGTQLEPLVRGAGHEKGLRPGTENVAFIAGLGKACEIALKDMDKEGKRVQQLSDRLWRLLADAIPGMELNGDPENRLPNTLNVRFPAVSGNELLKACPTVAASTGSACHANGDSASSVITAMGIPESKAIGSVRLSLGRQNTPEQITLAATALITAWQQVKN